MSERWEFYKNGEPIEGVVTEDKMEWGSFFGVPGYYRVFRSTFPETLTFSGDDTLEVTRIVTLNMKDK